MISSVHSGQMLQAQQSNNKKLILQLVRYYTPHNYSPVMLIVKILTSIYQSFFWRSWIIRFLVVFFFHFFHRTTHNHSLALCLGLSLLLCCCLGLPGWASSRSNIHPLTSILIIGHPSFTAAQWIIQDYCILCLDVSCFFLSYGQKGSKWHLWQLIP